MIVQSRGFVRSCDKLKLLYISTNTRPLTTKHGKVVTYGGGGGQFDQAFGDLKFLPTSGEKLNQMGGLKFSTLFLGGGQTTKFAKVCLHIQS